MRNRVFDAIVVNGFKHDLMIAIYLHSGYIVKQTNGPHIIGKTYSFYQLYIDKHYFNLHNLVNPSGIFY